MPIDESMSDVVAPAAIPPSAEPVEERPSEAPGSGLYPPRRSGRSTRMIGEVVVDLGFADRETVDQAVEVARAQGRPTGLVLVEQGILRHDQLARVVAERFGLDYVDLSVYDLDMGAVNLLSSEAAKRYQAVPIGFSEDDTLLLAMADPTNVLTIDDVAMMTGRRVRPVAASMEDLNLLLTRMARMDESIEDIVEDGTEAEEEADLQVDEADRDAPIIKLVHSIVAQAVQQGASDIHVNPEEGDTRVLFRVDGVLAPAATIKRKMAMGVVSRIKIMADLDISEKRLPQDGRFALTVDGRRVDIRVVTLPLVHGEGVVMRILDRGAVVQGLESLGMPAAELERFTSAINKPNGAVLVTGPTGSGKSTTLAAMIHHINCTMSKHIVTIEDPIEFVHSDRCSAINQREVGMDTASFKRALRRVLRQDPDVILVGEMRDEETVHTALSAAETGHLVLSTIHTVDATESINRMLDFFPPHQHSQARSMIAGTIKGVISQRLVPGADGGRVAVCEVMRMTGRVRDMIVDSAQTGKLMEVIASGGYYGMQTFDQALFGHVKAGRVTFEDAMSVASSPHDFKLLMQADGRRGTSMEDVADAQQRNVPVEASPAAQRPPGHSPLSVA
jgi:type IV pilus assembly protein PilB